MTKQELEEQLSTLKEALSLINNTIKNNVTFPTSLSIAGRVVTYRSLKDLLEAREKIMREIVLLERAIRILDGGYNPFNDINLRLK